MPCSKLASKYCLQLHERQNFGIILIIAKEQQTPGFPLFSAASRIETAPRRAASNGWAQIRAGMQPYHEKAKIKNQRRDPM
jgi:hypothetical protein